MSVDILTLRAGIQAPAEVFVSCAEFAGLSLDLLRPSSVSCNTGNPPGEIAGMGVADQGEEHVVPICPEVPGPGIPGVNEDETEPEIPGVEVAEGNEVVEDGDDQPTRVEVTVEPPPAPPEADNNSGGRYNLHGGRSRSYNIVTLTKTLSLTMKMASL